MVLEGEGCKEAHLRDALYSLLRAPRVSAYQDQKTQELFAVKVTQLNVANAQVSWDNKYTLPRAPLTMWTFLCSGHPVRLMWP